MGHGCRNFLHVRSVLFLLLPFGDSRRGLECIKTQDLERGYINEIHIIARQGKRYDQSERIDSALTATRLRPTQHYRCYSHMDTAIDGTVRSVIGRIGHRQT